MRFAILALLAFLSAQVHATPLTFAESDIGDFSGDETSPTHVGTLDLGLNWIAGTVAGDLPGDNDFFQVDLPFGMIITSVIVSIFPEEGAFGFVGVHASDANWGHFVNGAGSHVLGDDPEEIPIDLNSPIYTASATRSAWGYLFEIQVATAPRGVPEPSTSALMLLGLAGVGFLRRRTAA